MSPLRGFFGAPPPPPPDPPPPPPPDTDWTALFDLLEEGVLAVDAAKRVVLANRRMTPLLGQPSRHAPGKPLWEMIRQREITEMVDRALGGRPTETAEIPMTADGERLFRVTVTGLGAAAGPAVLLTFADLTLTRRLEAARKDFVANVSHELKTPLTALRASLETLLDGALDDKDHARDFLATALDQVERLQRLIDDLLALSRLEKSGAVPAAACDAGEVGRRVLAALTPVAAKHNVTIHPTATTTAVPVAISADELTQVLMNLFDNAIKFNRAGGTVAFALEAKADRVYLRIRDTGVGIAPEDQPRVFERFYRADKARSKDTGGTGLGLAIVKHIVENRGGALRLESRLGEGSLFEVALPAPAGE